MIDCTFELNGKPMSVLQCGASSFKAFSGLGEHVNKRPSACLSGKGPIPPGTYYIVDRQSGGTLGPLWDFINGRDEWFALYAKDAVIDDETFCDEVRRGLFRLHPKGPSGRSEGCVVIEKRADFDHLRGLLKKSPTGTYPGLAFECYGKLEVT